MYDKVRCCLPSSAITACIHWITVRSNVTVTTEETKDLLYVEICVSHPLEETLKGIHYLVLHDLLE